MNKTEVLQALEAIANENCKKTYMRHGVLEPLLGVRYGDLYKIVKKIGVDQGLAEELWATGIHDARVCAAMIADPAQVTTAALDKWAQTANNQLILDAIAGLTNKTKHARKCMVKWMASKQEWIAATGWHVLAGGCCGRPGEAQGDIAALTDAELDTYLDHIEKNIHTSPNRVRHSMNGALIAIGLRSDDLQKKAIAAAKRIGKVEVDHGDTACETPDAASYIKKAADYQKKRAAKATMKKTGKKTTTKAATKKTSARKVARAR